jgi:hypothetical protein
MAEALLIFIILAVTAAVLYGGEYILKERNYGRVAARN